MSQASFSKEITLPRKSMLNDFNFWKLPFCFALILKDINLFSSGKAGKYPAFNWKMIFDENIFSNCSLLLHSTFVGENEVTRIKFWYYFFDFTDVLIISLLVIFLFWDSMKLFTFSLTFLLLLVKCLSSRAWYCNIMFILQPKM